MTVYADEGVHIDVQRVTLFPYACDVAVYVEDPTSPNGGWTMYLYGVRRPDGGRLLAYVPSPGDAHRDAIVAAFENAGVPVVVTEWCGEKRERRVRHTLALAAGWAADDVAWLDVEELPTAAGPLNLVGVHMAVADHLALCADAVAALPAAHARVLMALLERSNGADLHREADGLLPAVAGLTDPQLDTLWQLLEDDHYGNGLMLLATARLL